MRKEMLIVVHKLGPDDFRGKKIVRTKKALIQVIASQSYLDITPGGIIVSCLPDSSESATSQEVEEVLITVEMLSYQPRMTPESRMSLIREIIEAFQLVQGNRDQAVGVLVKQFDPRQASYWSTGQ